MKQDLKKTNLFELPKENVKSKQPKIYDTKCDNLAFQ